MHPQTRSSGHARLHTHKSTPQPRQTCDRVVGLAVVPSYESVASIASSLCPKELRNLSTQATLVANACFDRHILEETRRPPWTLAVGEIRHNLEKLANASPQQHPAAEKIRALVLARWPMDDLACLSSSSIVCVGLQTQWGRCMAA